MVLILSLISFHIHENMIYKLINGWGNQGSQWANMASKTWSFILALCFVSLFLPGVLFAVVALAVMWWHMCLSINSTASSPWTHQELGFSVARWAVLIFSSRNVSSQKKEQNLFGCFHCRCFDLSLLTTLALALFCSSHVTVRSIHKTRNLNGIQPSLLVYFCTLLIKNNL